MERCPHRVALVVAMLLNLVLITLGARAAVEDEATKAPRIRQIRYDRGNVFTEAEAGDVQIFGIANRLHLTTREHVVRRELLFAEGEQLDPELIAATERALRSLEFINEADIRVIPVDDDSVDLEVHTRDAWTIVPGILFESGGGITNVGLTGSETNLAGFGKEVWFEGNHKTDEGTGFAAGYRDPQVLSSRWIASTSGRTSPLTDSFNAAVIRPFYSPDTAWAYGAHGGWHRSKIRLFDSGDEVSRIRESRQNAQIFVAQAMGERFNKLTAELRFAYDEERNERISGDAVVLPEDELTLMTSLGLFYRKEDWVEDKRIRKMTITEDIQLGFNVGGRVGRAGFPVPEGQKHWRPSASYRHAFAPGENEYLFVSSAVSSENDRNVVLALGGQFYSNRLDWQTLALNVSFRRAWKFESSRQFTLGGESGLRGFPARRFDGNKTLLINAEGRFFSPVEVWTVAIGSVAFVDAGRAYARGDKVDLEELEASAGFGLRFGFTRAANEPTGRIDFGWPLTEGGFALTIGAEQHF